MHFRRLPGFVQLFYVSFIELLVGRDAASLNEIVARHQGITTRLNNHRRAFAPRTHGAKFPALQSQDQCYAGHTSIGYDPHNERFVTFGFNHLHPYVQKGLLARGQEQNYSFLERVWS